MAASRFPAASKADADAIAPRATDPRISKIGIVGSQVSKTAGGLLVAKVQEALPTFSLVDEFLLRFGRPFAVEFPPAGAPRLTRRWCFRNAWLLVLKFADWTYAEGYCLAVNGEFFEHGWAITDQGLAVEPRGGPLAIEHRPTDPIA
jgi:hypothetical protein